MTKLELLRKEIDKIDDEIISLLEKRFSLVKELSREKKEVTDKKREEFILKKIRSPYIQNVYQEIFKNSKELQKKELESN